MKKETWEHQHREEKIIQFLGYMGAGVIGMVIGIKLEEYVFVTASFASRIISYVVGSLGAWMLYEYLRKRTFKL